MAQSSKPEPAGTADEDLARIEECLAGDQDAFEFLFNKYREKVYSIAYRFVRNKEDALEVTQEVFLRVYRNLDKFRTQSRFYTWLYRIAVNRAIDYTRRRKLASLTSLEENGFSEAGGRMPRRSRQPTPEEIAQASELKEKLDEAVDQLSPKHKAVFLLHAAEKLSYAEIAEVLGIQLGTVMSRLFYARKKLQEILERQGFDVPAARTRARRNDESRQ